MATVKVMTTLALVNSADALHIGSAVQAAILSASKKVNEWRTGGKKNDALRNRCRECFAKQDGGDPLFKPSDKKGVCQFADPMWRSKELNVDAILESEELEDGCVKAAIKAKKDDANDIEEKLIKFGTRQDVQQITTAAKNHPGLQNDVTPESVEKTLGELMERPDVKKIVAETQLEPNKKSALETLRKFGENWCEPRTVEECCGNGDKTKGRCAADADNIRKFVVKQEDCGAVGHVAGMLSLIVVTISMS